MESLFNIFLLFLLPCLVIGGMSLQFYLFYHVFITGKYTPHGMNHLLPGEDFSQALFSVSAAVIDPTKTQLKNALRMTIYRDKIIFQYYRADKTPSFFTPPDSTIITSPEQFPQDAYTTPVGIKFMFSDGDEVFSVSLLMRNRERAVQAFNAWRAGRPETIPPMPDKKQGYSSGVDFKNMYFFMLSLFITMLSTPAISAFAGWVSTFQLFRSIPLSLLALLFFICFLIMLDCLLLHLEKRRKQKIDERSKENFPG